MKDLTLHSLYLLCLFAVSGTVAGIIINAFSCEPTKITDKSETGSTLSTSSFSLDTIVNQTREVLVVSDDGKKLIIDVDYINELARNATLTRNTPNEEMEQ